eukprot:m.110909 g.110909  ORF g.110909 m.110909 type:complete len:271 (+) comp14051_c0_seq3:269-1081(+)
MAEAQTQLLPELKPRVAKTGPQTLAQWVKVGILGVGLVATMPFVLVGYTVVAFTVGKRFTSWAASLFIPVVMDNVDKTFEPVRHSALKDIQGKVLDVGCGDAPYLKYYSKKADKISELILLEPNLHLKPQILNKIELYRESLGPLANNTHVKTHFIEDFHSSENGTFDWIILGNVLCEVPNPQSVLKMVLQLLKPGGYCYFQEHCRSPQGSISQKIQDVINPYYVVLSDGCNINRTTLESVKSLNWKVENWQYGKGFIIMQVGLAKKPVS